MVIPTKMKSNSDAFSGRYAELLEASYDCIDRIVINAYNPLLQQAGGFRHWWRQWQGSEDGLNTTTLMWMAGRFAKRVRASQLGQATLPGIHLDQPARRSPSDSGFGSRAKRLSRFAAHCQSPRPFRRPVRSLPR